MKWAPISCMFIANASDVHVMYSCIRCFLNDPAEFFLLGLLLLWFNQSIALIKEYHNDTCLSSP